MGDRERDFARWRGGATKTFNCKCASLPAPEVGWAPEPEPVDEEQRRRALGQARALTEALGGPASEVGCEHRRRVNLRMARGEE
jgi:hypothetical protein